MYSVNIYPALFELFKEISKDSHSAAIENRKKNYCLLCNLHKLLCYLILFTFLVLNQRFKLLAAGILGVQLGGSY